VSTRVKIDVEGLVWDHWRRHAEREPEREAIVHWVADEEPVRWRWGELLQAASLVAARLTEAGVKPGDVCALILRHHPGFYPTYLGISATGALPAVLAYPNNRLHPDKFRQGLEGMASRSGLDLVLTERDLDPVVRPLTLGEKSTVRDILFPLEWLAAGKGDGLAAHAPSRPEEPCLLQHSSGTTGLQKPVILSHRAVLEHLSRYAAALELTRDDRFVSWLPLYHDMGLIGAYYLPLVAGVPLVQMDPFEWVCSPLMQFEAMSRERGTLAYLPNFAYNLIAERARESDLQPLRLDCVRLLINCSEPVRAASHEKLHKRLAPYGLKREALSACYAMAETTFAVTQTAPGREARIVWVDREELSRGRAREVPEGPAARACVSSGTLISGCGVRILDDAGKELPEGGVGEILISSVSLFDGYRNYPEKTAEVLKDGWYASGDLGFRLGEDHFVIGRKKDLLIVAGNNIYPEDIEDAVGKVEGILPGRVIAFGLDDEAAGTEVVCVVAETAATGEEALRELRRAVVVAGMALDVTVSRVYLVPPRWLIKSSSGKPSRSANRSRAVAEMAWK